MKTIDLIAPVDTHLQVFIESLIKRLNEVSARLGRLLEILGIYEPYVW